MRQIMAVLFMLVFAHASFAQPNPDTLWTRTYGGSNDDAAYSVQQTIDGGYIVAGYTQSFGPGDADFYVVKTNSQGDTLWTRTYGGSDYDWASSVQQTADGGYIVAGYTLSFGAGNYDFYLVKTNSLGDTLWTRTYGGSSGDQAWSVQQTADGGYIVVGLTYLGMNNCDFYLVKTDAYGTQLWTRTYGGIHHDVASSVQPTGDGGYIVAGSTASFGAGGYDFYLVQTNSQGDTLLTRTYGGSSDDFGSCVQETWNADYIIAGTTGSFGAGNEDFYLVKTDGSGDTLWTRTYGGSSDDRAFSVQQTADGGYILAGITESFGAGNEDFYLVKADGSGDTLWTRTYGGGANDRAYSVQQTTDGWHIVAGYTASFGAGYEDFYVVKTGPERSISVQSPNGGENWHILQNDTVRWLGRGFAGGVKIELNRNYPAGTWEPLADNTGNDGEEAILVTEPLSGRCRVRVSALEDTLSDISDRDFSILCTQGYLTLVRPSDSSVAVLSWYAGTVDSGQSVSEGFRLRNFGGEAVIVSRPEEPATMEFSRTTDCAALLLLDPGEMSTCEITLVFNPDYNGTYCDTLLIQSDAMNAQGDYVRIPLLGEQLVSAMPTRGIVPSEFTLHPAWPNPFNPVTTIRFDARKTGTVSLSIFDLLGREVATPVKGTIPAGSYAVAWDAADLPSGIYFCRMEAAGFAQTRKIVLLK